MSSLHYKKFVYIFAGLLLLFLSFHAAMWFGLTSKLLDVQKPQQVGDLARLGYQLSSAHLRTKEILLPNRHIKAHEWDYSSVDIITIGDSFSNGGGGGKNPYYQDYIASNNALRVLNINNLSKDTNNIETLMAWYNNGLLEKTRPKAVLIESIERLALARFAKTVRWDSNLSVDALKHNIKTRSSNTDAPKVSKPTIINTANYKIVFYNLFYLFSDNAFKQSLTYKRELSRDLFSGETKNTLLFYQQDITSIPLVNEKNIRLMNENFNTMAQKLEQLDIKLYVMIAPDKYDLYQEYIIDNPYQKNNFFPLLRELEKEYTFIDTKKVLLDMVQEGQKDVYFADDTHWNYKASEAIF
ncbi:MAG: hypothetical protein ABFR02_07500, partial [Campylobacterota bacterium]